MLQPAVEDAKVFPYRQSEVQTQPAIEGCGTSPNAKVLLTIRRFDFSVEL
jgi:hypothetical protein